MSSDEEFSDVDAGASDTQSQKAGKIRKGAFIVINNRPCKVVDISTSKTGKHGHAKASITALDIFNGKKYETMCPTSHNVEIPIINRSEWQVVDVDDEGYCSLMNSNNEEKSDLKVLDETMLQGIRDALDAGEETVLVSVMESMGTEQIMEWKTVKE